MEAKKRAHPARCDKTIGCRKALPDPILLKRRRFSLLLPRCPVQSREFRQQLLSITDPEQHARHLALTVVLKGESRIRVRQNKFRWRDGLHHERPGPGGHLE
jgi:hypothetical protein